MASIIVLVRHGKAIAAGGSMEDVARPLTLFGKRALAASMPDLLLPLAYMPEFIQGETQIWSSAAFRAMETAEVVASTLGASQISEHMCLLEQDLEGFLSEVYDCDADIIVAVGHEPFVSQVAQRLCGVALPFKTGAVSIFDISDYAGKPAGGILRHFAQGPCAERWKTLVRMEEVLALSATHVKASMQLFLDDPQDVEALHDFRISVRTLRSNLAFVKPYTNRKQVKAIQSELRDLVAMTSYLRELDVFSQVIQDSSYSNDELLAAVSRMRQKECRKLLERIGGKKVRKSVRKLLDQVESLRWKGHINALGLSREDIIDRFELYTLAFEAAYLQTDYKDVDATHDLRKLAKRVRYASRDFGSIIGEEANEVAKAMKETQEELGALCDARVNCEIIDAMPRKKLSDAADTAIAAIKQEQIDIIMEILDGDDEGLTVQLDDEAMDIALPESVTEEDSLEAIMDILDAELDALEVEEAESYVDEVVVAVRCDSEEVEIADFSGDCAPDQDQE